MVGEGSGNGLALHPWGEDPAVNRAAARWTIAAVGLATAVTALLFLFSGPEASFAPRAPRDAVRTHPHAPPRNPSPRNLSPKKSGRKPKRAAEPRSGAAKPLLGEIRGRIVDGHGAGVPASFTVLLYKADAIPDPERFTAAPTVDAAKAILPAVTTGKDGAFTIRSVPAGTYQAVARSDWYIEAMSDQIGVEEGCVTKGVRIEVEAAGRVRGTVVARATGLPVRAARVRLVPAGCLADFFPGSPPVGDGFSGQPSVTASDGAGRFWFRGVRPGRYGIECEAKGFARQTVEDIEVRADRVTEGGTVSLGEGAAIAGTVFGEDGRPKAGVNLRVERLMPGVHPEGEYGRRVESDGQGRYRASHLAPGRYRVEVQTGDVSTNEGWLAPKSKPTALERMQFPIRLRDGDTKRHDVHLAALATVEVQVLSPTGPVHSSRVWLVDDSPRSAAHHGEERRRKTDEDGRVRFEAVVPGQWTISGGDDRERVTLSPGQDLSLTLRFVLFDVTGRVVDGKGKPVDRARVELTPEIQGSEIGQPDKTLHTVTGADGTFSVVGVATGEYELRVTKGRSSLDKYGVFLHPDQCRIGMVILRASRR